MFQAVAMQRRGINNRSKRRSKKRRKTFSLRRLSLESLESRHMLSATPLKLYVVNDATSNISYRYDEAGAHLGNSALASANSTPRGAASMIGIDKTWVIDANRNVYVYNETGGLLGSWSAGSMPSNATPEGIATNGTDIWIADSRSDKVYRYAGAFSRLSGSQTAVSSFALALGNSNAKDIVTDGASLWVVDDAKKTDSVYKYNITGGFVGSWAIDSAHKTPTGIALDPANVGDMWIADSGTDRVYKYTAAVSRNSGSQAATSSFALASSNTNPQGLAVAGRAWGETPLSIEWVRQFGSAADDIGRGVAADSAGHAYVSGHTFGSISVPNPTGVSTPYLAQFDEAGNLNWVQQSDPIPGDDQEGVRVAADSLGNVFQVIAPDASGSASLRNYDPMGTLRWTTFLPSGQDIFPVAVDELGYAYMTSYGNGVTYLRKLEGETGDVVWERSLATGGFNNSSGVSFDGLGNVYLVGYTYGSLIGPNAGLADGFAAKYDAAGNLQWTKQFGTSGYDFAFNIVADALGNVYAAGGVFASQEAWNLGDQDIFVTKLDAGGSVNWTRTLRTTGNDAGAGLRADGLGNVYITGSSTGALGGAHLGATDVVLGKYDPDGDLLWLQQYGTSGNEGGSGLTGDNSGNLYLSNRTTGSWGGTNAGSYDAVLIKLSPPPASLSASALSPVNVDAALAASVESFDSSTDTAQSSAVNKPGIGRTSMAATITERKASLLALLARQTNTPTDQSNEPSDGSAVDPARTESDTGGVSSLTAIDQVLESTI
jgi:hypothetical protein